MSCPTQECTAAGTHLVYADFFGSYADPAPGSSRPVRGVQRELASRCQLQGCHRILLGFCEACAGDRLSSSFGIAHGLSQYVRRSRVIAWAPHPATADPADHADQTTVLLIRSSFSDASGIEPQSIEPISSARAVAMAKLYELPTDPSSMWATLPTTDRDEKEVKALLLFRMDEFRLARTKALPVDAKELRIKLGVTGGWHLRALHFASACYSVRSHLLPP